MFLEAVGEAFFTPHAVSDYAMQSVKIEIIDNLFFMSNFSFKNNSKMFNSYLLSFF